MIFNSFAHPCTVIGVLTDLWKRAFTNMSFDVWSIDVWDDVTTDSLTTATVGVGVDILADVEVTVLVAVVISLEFEESLLCAVDVLYDVWDGTSIDADVMIDALARVFADTTTSVVTDVGVDMLTDVSVNVVAAAMTALEFTMSAS